MALMRVKDIPGVAEMRAKAQERFLREARLQRRLDTTAALIAAAYMACAILVTVLMIVTRAAG